MRCTACWIVGFYSAEEVILCGAFELMLPGGYSADINQMIGKAATETIS
jgi:hypothetical protein